jgi:hypothetical protein
MGSRKIFRNIKFMSLALRQTVKAFVLALFASDFQSVEALPGPTSMDVGNRQVMMY